jgi:glyoxylate reductase
MDTAPNLKAISVVGVGYDHVEWKAAHKRGIAVGHTPGCLNETTADMTFALLLATARNVRPANEYIQSREWTYYDPNILWGYDVHHATLGIVGMGGIGREVAKRAKGFDMRVLYNKRNRRPDWEAELGVEYATLDLLLGQSDFVTLHVPLTAETRHLIGDEELRKMKPTAVLVNMARGPVVDSRALYRALKEGEIAGAALDVTEPEPIPADDPLLNLDNVLITPHIGSATVQTRTRMADMAAENLLAALKGEQMPYSVFREDIP